MKNVITITYSDRLRMIEVNGEELICDGDSEVNLKEVMEIARKYPDCDIIEVEDY